MRAVPIDYLRIILCLLVIEHHYFGCINAGGIAVLGFFVLSGYFIEREFETKDTLNPFLFYKKKAINLLPEYLITTIPAFLVVTLLPSVYSVDFSRINRSPFVLISALEAANNPTWFLTRLFFFIAIAPIFFCLHQCKRGIPLAFISALLYGIILHKTGLLRFWGYAPAQICITYFLGGMLARQVVKQESIGKYIRISIAAFSTSALCLIIYLNSNNIGFPFSNYVICLLFMLLLPALYVSTQVSSCFTRLIIRLSILSYAMYLFHSPIKRAGTYILMRLTGHSEEELLLPGVLCVFLILTVLAAELFQRVKTHFISSSGNK